MVGLEIFRQYGCRKILPDIDNDGRNTMKSGVWPHRWQTPWMPVLFRFLVSVRFIQTISKESNLMLKYFNSSFRLKKFFQKQQVIVTVLGT